MNNDTPRTYGRDWTMELLKRLAGPSYLPDLIAHIEELLADVRELRIANAQWVAAGVNYDEALMESLAQVEAKLQAAERVVEAARYALSGIERWRDAKCLGHALEVLDGGNSLSRSLAAHDKDQAHE